MKERSPLSHQLSEAVLIAVHKMFDSPPEIPIVVKQASSPTFGDYQTNCAMVLAKKVGQKPLSLAQEIADLIESPLVDSVTTAPPGFINITLNHTSLEDGVNYLTEDPRLGCPLPQEKERIIVEFSSPNVAKQLHVAHLRSTIIGDAIARLFEFVGHQVIRLNHIGDRGTPFGMLIAHMRKKGLAPSSLEAVDKAYKEARAHFDEDPDFALEAQQEVVRLQNKESDSIKRLEDICSISRKAFEEIYSLLNISIEERGESFYESLFPLMDEDLRERGLSVISDEANCIFLDAFKRKDGEPLPLIVKKKDGGFPYAMVDLAAMKYRSQEDHAQRIIVVTDQGQSLHFQMVHAAAVKAGYLDPDEVQFDHVTFGLVLGEQGSKIKSREGKAEKLIDLIQDAIEEANRLMSGRLDCDPEKKKDIAQRIGIGALKYADLSCQRTKNYVFSPSRMLRFEGNTAPFLLYGYVRMASLFRKATVQGTFAEGTNTEGIMVESDTFSILHPSERSLALHLCQFPEMVEVTTKDLMPHHIAEYLYRLVEKFNAFFRDCRVLGDSKERSRLQLCSVCQKVLQQGLHLLGIETVDYM